MKNIIFIILLLPIYLFAQEKFTLSGYVTDSETGESIIGANIYCSAIKQGVTSNSFGFYSLTLPSNAYQISYSFMGYKTIAKQISLNYDSRLDIEFLPSSINLDEIELTGEANIVKSTQTSVIDIPISQIKSIPAFLGEVDVLKAIQLLPGVQSSEGTSGFYVRGGGPDQNLILMDGVPVYNASHIGGLFSVFNADAINNVRLTKGGFPAKFGGRLSSVLQIDLKEGNMKEFKGDITLGLVSSKITLEGPIVKDKTSFIFSARRTYIDLIARTLIPSDEKFSLYFYDFNTKINHKLSDSDRIFLSVYSGRDVFKIEDRTDEPENNYSENFGFGIGWGNLTSMIRWNHLFSDKLFANTKFAYSRYSFDTNIEYQSISGNTDEFRYNYISGIEDFSFGMDFDYMPHPNHDVKFGFSYTNHRFFPGISELNINQIFDENETDSNFSLDTTFNFSPTTIAHELYYYVQDEIKFSDRFKANIGCHIGVYGLGDNESFSSNVFDLDNYNIQPRVSSRYLINEDWSFKASYAQMQQNIHLLTNSSVGLPTDIWVPALDSVPSQRSSQIAAGITTQLENGKYEISIEGYYKKMSDLITYKEGYSNLINTESWVNSVETGGEGASYGLELFVQKKKGRTTGWIGYTLSWTNRKFQNINFGDWYPFKYDRRHDISIVCSHKFNDNIDVGGTWVYGTGNAINFPDAVYLGLPSQGWGQQNIDLVESYGERNSLRMNPYHRLDFSANFRKHKKKFSRTWSIGFYNMYNRRNPFFIYLSEQNNQRVANQVSLFPVIPFISYNVKF